MAFDAGLEKPPTSAAGEADGVTYTTTEHAPGLKFFRCEPYRANLSIPGCASRWSKAQGAYGDVGATFAKCAVCATGAAHAGRGHVRYSPWYKSGICCRCGRGGSRMIGNRLCVSCYNRNRELRIGKNARGNVPIELMQRPLHRIEVLVEVDGEARRLVDRETSGLTETMIQFLRTHTGEIAFGWAGARVAPLGAEAPTAPAEDPADDADVDPGEAALDTAGANGWLITDRRCQACSGRVLRGAGATVVHRCADCGNHGEGELEEARETELTIGDKPAPDLDVNRREVCRYRARLFATVSHQAVGRAWGMWAVR